LRIRVALGGQRKEVLQAALGRTFKLLAFGSAAGSLLGLLATPVVAFIVDQATPRDPLVLAGVVLVIASDIRRLARNGVFAEVRGLGIRRYRTSSSDF
jgi:hypothetical protein